MPNRPLSAIIDVLSRDSRVRENTSDAVSYLLDLLYYGEFRIFEQVSSSLDALDFVNLVGIKSGPNAKGAPLWLVSCVGTGSSPVPSHWASTGGDMFEPSVNAQTGLLHGLGTNSGKLDFILKILAASRLKAAELTRPVAVIGLFGEESRSTGLRTLVDQGDVPGTALFSAPTNLDVWTHHPGCIAVKLEVERRVRHRRMPPTRGIFELNVPGSSAHAQWPGSGLDACQRALDILQMLRAHGDLRVLVFDAGEGGNRIAGKCTLTVATSYAELPSLPRDVSVTPLGDGVSLPFPIDALLNGWLTARDAASAAVADILATTTDAATATITRKSAHTGWLASGRDVMAGVVTFWTAPGQSGRTQDIVEAFAHAAQNALRGQEELALSIQVLQDRPALAPTPPGPLRAALAGACRDSGLRPAFTGGRITSDAGLLAAAGAECLAFGPGRSGAELYRDDESVPLVQVNKTVEVYDALLKRLCTAQ